MNTVYRCETCEKTFLTVEALFFHLLVVEKENPFKALTWLYILNNLLLIQLGVILGKLVIVSVEFIVAVIIGVIYIVTTPFVYLNNYIKEKLLNKPIKYEFKNTVKTTKKK